MSFDDEERLKQKRQYEESLKEQQKEEAAAITSIYDGPVLIGDKEYVFKERQIGDLPCYIYMPETFVPYNEEQLKFVSMGKQPPMFIFGEENFNMSISVNLTESPLPKARVKELWNVIDRVIESMVPQARIVKRDFVEKDDYPIGIVEFISGGLYEKMFNRTMISSLNDKMLAINIYTSKSTQETLYPVMKEISESLRVEEDDKHADNDTVQ